MRLSQSQKNLKKNLRQFFAILCCCFVSTNCSLFSGKVDLNPDEQEITISDRVYKEIMASRLTALEREKITYELGLNPDQEITPEQDLLIRARYKSRLLERGLSATKERDQYSKVLPWLKNDFERIELLLIPSIEGRQAWVNQKQIWQRASTTSKEMAPLLITGDIVLGMPQDLVRKSWGEPQNIEVSGNPVYKNEKWKYSKQVSTAQGYRNEERVVFFEGGRVVGWETE